MPTEDQRKWIQSALGVTPVAVSRPTDEPVSSGATGNTKKAPDEPNPSAEKQDGLQQPELRPSPQASNKPEVAEPNSDATKPFAISSSVGHHGKNKPEDVKAVQVALNQRAKADLAEDGKFGSKTLAAIKAYQKQLGFRKPDGLVESGKRTAIALSGAKVGPPEESEQVGSGDGSETESNPAESESTKTSRASKRDITDSEAIESALETARHIAEREKKTVQSCSGWIKKITDTLAGVTEDEAVAEGTKIREELKKVVIDHYNGPVLQVKVAAKKLAEERTAKAAEVVNQAVEAALPGFKVLDDLMDEAMSWTTLNSHPVAAEGERRVGGPSKEGLRMNKENLDVSRTIESAIQAAREIGEREARTEKTCEAALNMFAKKLGEVSGDDAVAECKKIRAELEKAYNEHRKNIKLVEDAEKDLARRKTVDAAGAVKKACQAADQGFKALDDLTQAAMEWQAFNTRPAAAGGSARRKA